MNPASYDVRVDWSGDGSFDEVGDDISGRVFDRGTPLTLQYGRDQARAFAPLTGGRGQFELDNTSRDYSPENTSSPLVGKLLPGRDVRIQATLGDLRLVTDPFDRTVAGGWGTEPTTGLSWAISGGLAAQYSVSAGAGRHAVEVLNATRRTRLPVSLTDVEVLMSFSSDVLAVGGNQECSPMLRIDPADIGGTYYYAEVEFSTTQTVRCRLVRRLAGGDTGLTFADPIPGLTHAVNRVFWVRARVVGSALKMRVWQDGTTEPTAWHAEATDTAIPGPGQVGVRSILDPTNTNTLPVNFAVGDFVVDLFPYDLFRGNMDGFTVLPAIEQQSVQVTLLDALSRLKTERVTTTLYSGLRTGDAIGLLLDAVGWTAGRDLDPGASTLPWWWADDTEAFTLLQAILDAEGPGCLATVGADGSFIFRDRHHRLLRAASTTVQATFRSEGVEPCYSDLEYDQGWSDIVNSVGFAIPIRQPAGERSQVWQMSGQRSIADGETVLLSASSSTPFFRAVVPEAGTDFTVLSGAVTVVLSGTSGASVTVLVTAVGGPAVIDGMALRAYPLITQATVLVTAEDSTSVARYGRRSWQSGRDPDLAGLPDALAIADIILAHRAERLPTVTITLKGGVSERMVQQLARDLSDRVHITDAGSGLDADCWLEQIAHTAANGDHVTVFGCERIPTPPTGLLVLDDAAVGLLDTGKLGGIGLSTPTTVFILDDATQAQLGTVTALLGV